MGGEKEDEGGHHLREDRSPSRPSRFLDTVRAVQARGRALLGAISCPDSRPVLCTDSYGNYCVQAPDVWNADEARREAH